jgi:alpha-ribazole phosphatase
VSRIFFIRHAETDMAGRFCGHSDPPLSDRGYAQLPALIRRLRAWNIGAVYTSDLRRAQMTANAIASTFNVGFHANPALREINFGEWEGLTWDEIEHRDEAYASRWMEEYPNLPAPRGEIFRDFEDRTLNAVKSLAMTSVDHDIVVVTHAGVLRAVLRHLQGCSEKESWEQTRSYCCILQHVNAASSPMQTHEVNL